MKLCIKISVKLSTLTKCYGIKRIYKGDVDANSDWN